MSREIGKYRGQRKDNGECVYGWLCIWQGVVYIFDSPFNLFRHGRNEVIPETVGEFTGIKDDHGTGKEIYESDKVTRGDGMIYIVIWRKIKGQWWLREYVGEKLRGWSVPLMQAAEGYIEVIGSIHDNLEIVNSK